MAVRDDFAAGEVLSADDLNDTFASKLPYSYGTATPSTSVDGFLWYDDNDTPPTPKFWDGSAFQNVAAAGGLELIASETFSGVSSISVNGCFTSDYENYKLLVRSTPSSNVAHRLRFRSAGSDNSSGIYSHAGIRVFSGSSSVISTNTNTSWNISLGAWDASKFYSMDLTVFGPALVTNTTGHSQMQTYFSSNPVSGTNGLVHRTATAFDGFTLFPDSGTFTGTVRVYGYKD